MYFYEEDFLLFLEEDLFISDDEQYFNKSTPEILSCDIEKSNIR